MAKATAPIRFKTRLLRPAKPADADWLFFVLPEAASNAFPTRSQVSVDGALAGQPFQVTLDPDGTPFQRAVWKEISTVPFGETISYGELARRTGLRVVWDILHHHCNDPDGIPDREALEAALATWPAEQTPKMHYSSQRTAMEQRARRAKKGNAARHEFLLIGSNPGVAAKHVKPRRERQARRPPRKAPA